MLINHYEIFLVINNIFIILFNLCVRIVIGIDLGRRSFCRCISSNINDSHSFSLDKLNYTYVNSCNTNSDFFRKNILKLKIFFIPVIHWKVKCLEIYFIKCSRL